MSAATPTLLPLPEDAPESFAKHYALLRSNGIRCVQAPGMGTKNTFVIAWCAEGIEDVIKRVKAASGSKTLVYDDWLSRCYITVHWTEVHFIPVILTAMLANGQEFRLTTRSECKFGPKYGDTVWSWDRVEPRVIRAIKEMEDAKWFGPHMYKVSTLFPDTLTDPWNWETDEGKQMCAHLRHVRGLPPITPEQEAKENYHHWPIFREWPDTIEPTYAPLPRPTLSS